MRVVIDNQKRTVHLAEDRRGAHRNRVLKGAVLTFNRGHSAFECVVRNQSVDGAKLSLAESFALPNSFDLAVMDGSPRAVQVVWRSPDAIGIRYA